MNCTRRDFTRMAAMAGAFAIADSSVRAAPAAFEDMPGGACDCHVHIVGPLGKYAMDPDRVYTAGEASVVELRALHERLGVQRTVLIQPSFYGANNSCMLDALAELGDSARAVAVLPQDVAESELMRLDRLGVRGIRVNLETGGARDPRKASAELLSFAKRLAPLGWHIQLYAALPVIAELAPQIGDLPVEVVIDHFGGPVAAQGAGQPGFATLLDLVRNRSVFVKLSGCYRISKARDYADVASFARALIEAGPDRLVWGSDWPHTGRLNNGSRTEIAPYQPIDDAKVLGLLPQWCPDPSIRRLILADTPAKLYKFAF